jgi:hypothetical protein
VSPRRFDGWEPTEVTTYEYDEQGRVARATTVREPEWSEQDQFLMLALARYRDDLCPSCHGDMHETTDIANDDGYRSLPPIRCHRCTELARSAERYRDEPHPGALLHQVVVRNRR